MSHAAKRTRTRRELEDRFRAALPKGAELRELDGWPAAFHNGHLFARIRKDHVIVRLAEADRKAILAEPGASVFEPIKGRPMAEYAVLPDASIDDAALLAHWFVRGHRYVGGLETQAAATTPRTSASLRGAPSARNEKTKV